MVSWIVFYRCWYCRTKLFLLYWYTIVKRVYANLYKHIPNHKPGTFTELFLGALAAAISQCFTMPIGVITTQQQTDKSHKNLFQLIQDILDQDGISGYGED